MLCFPMFMKLEGRRVLICGGGTHALDKIKRLRPYGAELVVLCENPSKELENYPGIELRRQAFEKSLLELNPAFVVCACDEEENQRIADLCRAYNVPVNAVDQPADCDFYFPAIVEREPVTIGISTAGASPAAAVELKVRISEFLPEALPEIVAWHSGLRGKYDRHKLRRICSKALDEGRVLSDDELKTMLE